MFASQLSSILDHVAALRRLDTTGVRPTSHPFELVNVLRADVVVPSLDHDVALWQCSRQPRTANSRCRASSARPRERGELARRSVPANEAPARSPRRPIAAIKAGDGPSSLPSWS